MFFKRFSVLVLAALFLAGCASKSKSPLSSRVSLYGSDKRAEFESGTGGDGSKAKFGLLSTNSLFAEDESGLFLLQPNSQTWKTYYYFFHLRKRVFEDFPHVVPESESDIPVVLNGKVHRFLEYFQNSGRGSFSIWLSRSGKYVPVMKGILESKGLPIDLVYLAMIESGFSVKAKSYKGAVGPWQFIPATAKRYGLRVDSWVDERMDPEKSTIAAANYLRDLYDMFQSWELAAAGYNCGEERVQAAIDMYKVSDFWEISEYTLPRETKDYVPKLMAALIIAKNPERYGFRGIQYQNPEPSERTTVPPQRSLRDIAKIIGVSDNRLTDLNPSLIRGSTPPGSPYEIIVPSGYKEVVATRYNSISALRTVIASDNSVKYIRHRVRRGESLGKIASRYGVSVSAVKRASRIRSSTIRVGQVLTIPKYGSSGTYVATKNERITVQRNSSIKYKVRRGDTLGGIAGRHGVSVSSIKTANYMRGSKIRVGQMLSIPGGNMVSKKGSGGDVVKYHVRRGDTLWNIASKYDVPVSSIKKWNNLRSSRLDSGDRLTIYVK